MAGCMWGIKVICLRQKTVDAFNRLPKEFTNEDLMRCFQLNTESSVRVKVHRLLKDHVIVKRYEVGDDGIGKQLYVKTGRLLL